MALSATSLFSLTSEWSSGSDGDTYAYVLRLTNQSKAPIRDFRLCVSGPARVAPGSVIEGGVLAARLSNHTEFAPEEDFVLHPGGQWEITVRGVSEPLQHWTSGATSSYLVLADKSILPLLPQPTTARGDNRPLMKGTRKFPVPPKAPVPVSIIPWPEHVAVSGRRIPPVGLILNASAEPACRASRAFTELTERLFPAEAIARAPNEGGIPVHFRIGTQSPEAYRITFAKTEATIEASHVSGFFYGLVTLGQILRGSRLYPETFVFPMTGTIDDQPAMGWRGTHLDVARQFYSVAEVTRLLRILAWNKMNRFHWHLSDDEAWRVEIDAYPALTEIGAWRGHGLAIPPLLGSGPEPTGGYYTKEDIRQVVALADDLGITVVPEIDVPGHCFAMQEAIPDLRDPGETGTYFSVQGFPNNCLNPARPETYAILETILDELIAIFPSRIFHVGADEVPLAAWSGSPQALAQLSKVGGTGMADAHARLVNTLSNAHGADAIEGTGAAALQAEFLHRVQGFLASRGCTTGGWEEAAHGNVIDKSKVYLVGWRDVAISGKLAGEGYDMVVSPGQAYYLDMSQSTEWPEPGASWAGWSGPEETYAFDPVAGWTEAQRKHLLGVQACIWSEPMTDRAVFDRLVFPRLSAIAETGWTRPAAKSWERFCALAGLMPNLYGHWGE
jgi:hexosaminidase